MRKNTAQLLLSALFSAVGTMAPFTVTAQTALQTYRPGSQNDGVVYFLPKTTLQVIVTTEKTEYMPGDFAAYAQRYLRLTNVSLTPQVSHRILGVRMRAVAVADTTKAYQLKLNPKTVAPNVVLSGDGRLLAINTEALTEPVFQPFAAAPKQPLANPRQFMNEEMLSAGSTMKMAELTAREIYDLRENRNLLIKGQADFMPKDGEQLRLMLAQLDQQDAALTSMFSGTTVRDTAEHIITLSADAPVDHLVAFRLSQRLGMVDADDLSGTPYYINIEDLHAVQAPVDDAPAKGKKKQPEAGVYVNVPGRMRVTLLQSQTLLSQSELPAPQFGNVELLSGELFNKHFTTRLWLNPVTGAVERLEAEQPK